jgi:hypothetical protein
VNGYRKSTITCCGLQNRHSTIDNRQLRDGAQKSIPALVLFLVKLQKRVKMVVEALPEWRCLGSARTIDLLHHAAQCRQGGVSSNGIPFEKV